MVCTGVTEPNFGLDTSRTEPTAERVSGAGGGRGKADEDGEDENGEDDGEYVVNGQKIRTSKAQEADVIMLLARTGPRGEGGESGSSRFDGLSLFFHRLRRRPGWH